MSADKNTRTVNVVLRPASPALKIAVIVLILCSIAALFTLRWVHKGLLAETEKLRAEAAAVAYDNEVLEEKTGKPDSVQNVQSIAKQELGMISPDTVVIEPVS